jgi:hypothetical protein
VLFLNPVQNPSDFDGNNTKHNLENVSNSAEAIQKQLDLDEGHLQYLRFLMSIQIYIHGVWFSASATFN